MKIEQKASGPETVESGGQHAHRVLVVENHPIVRHGIQALINSSKDLEVCGIADDRQSALNSVESLKPDLVLLEITLKDNRGLDLLKEVKTLWPDVRVLVLSMHDEKLFAVRAVRLRASGYVMKQEEPTTILEAIRKALRGGIYVSGRIASSLVRPGSRRQRRSAAVLDPLETLSARQLEVFRLIGKGRSTAEIAAELELSIKTVETHRSHLKEKLNLKTGRELGRMAIEMIGDGAL